MRNFLFLLLATTLALPAAAHANPIDFHLTGPGTDITFQLLDGGFYTTYPQANELSIAPISMVDNGVSGPGGVFFFYLDPSQTAHDLTVSDLNDDNIILTGPSLLASGIFDPQFVLGTYYLPGHDNTGSATYTLVIGPDDPSPAATPEPDTLTLIGTKASSDLWPPSVAA